MDEHYLTRNLVQQNAITRWRASTTLRIVHFEGNFKEYDADLRRRKGADADTPHRVTYKKLVRS
jgi:hypothetical protein